MRRREGAGKLASVESTQAPVALMMAEGSMVDEQAQARQKGQQQGEGHRRGHGVSPLGHHGAGPLAPPRDPHGGHEEEHGQHGQAVACVAVGSDVEKVVVGEEDQ
jgi:hypothetical protein